MAITTNLSELRYLTDAEVILKRFWKRKQGEGEGDSSALTESNWRWIEHLLRSAVTDTAKALQLLS
jgi:hypothetical protein